MTADTLDRLRQLYGPRDGYVGEHLPAVAEVREPVRIVSLHRSGDLVLLAIADGPEVSYWRVASPDDHRLQVLSAGDRSRVHSALSAIHRDGGPPDAA